TAQMCTLQLADISYSGFKRDTDIDILIGADNYCKAVTGSIKQPEGDVTAVETIFGWTLLGPVRPLPEVGWHQATVMQVITRHQCDQPSQHLREKNTRPVPEEDVAEPKQSTITCVPVSEEAARKDSNVESGETEALEWALCTSELSASDSKEDTGIPDENVIINDVEGDKETPTGTVETRFLKPVNLISDFVSDEAGLNVSVVFEQPLVGIQDIVMKKCRRGSSNHGSSFDHRPELPPRITRKRGKYYTPVPEKRMLARSQRDIQVGDVVLLRNDRRPKTFWYLAVVDDTFPGQDGKVGACTIRLGRGVKIRRPIQLLCLEIPTT
ncbi:hypothetical protein HPB47_013913, partial [Ixodes persulcatus]